MEGKIGLPKITHTIFPTSNLRLTYKGVLEDYWYVKMNCSEFFKISTSLFLLSEFVRIFIQFQAFIITQVDYQVYFAHSSTPSSLYELHIYSSYIYIFMCNWILFSNSTSHLQYNSSQKASTQEDWEMCITSQICLAQSSTFKMCWTAASRIPV